MRWIFLCLISFNLVFFSWQQWLASDKSIPIETVDVSGEVQGERLILLTERLPEVGSAVPPPSIGVGAPVHQAVDHVDHKKEALCPHIGPFDGELEANSLVDNLSSDAYKAQVQAVEIAKTVDNWVLIPPKTTRKESMALLRELQAKKVDSYLVAEGPHKNAISLGLFKKLSSAKGVKERMQAAGYVSEVKAIERISYEYWVRVDVADENDLRIESLETRLMNEKNVSFSKSLCETFAQRL